MKRRSLWTWVPMLMVLLMVGTISAASAPQALPVVTKIDAVTVYPRRALITRLGSLLLPAGEHRVEVRGLPYYLIDRSIGVGATGTGGLTLLGVEVKRYYTGAKRAEAEIKLRARIEAVREESRALSDRRRVVGQQLIFLRRLSNITAQRMAKQTLVRLPDGQKLAALMDFVEARALKLMKAKRRIAALRRKLSRKLRDLHGKLRLMRRGISRRSKVVVIRVRAKRQGKMKVKVSYLIRGATWRPIYVARRKVGSNRIELAMSGQIRQRTGEDWKGIRLTLSTARPSLGAAAPRLYPRYLSFYPLQPPKPKRKDYYKGRRHRRGGNGTGAARPEAAPTAGVRRSMTIAREATADRITAAISTSLGSHQFKIKYQVDVPSDGNFHKTAILVKELKSELIYVAVPSRTRRVFMRAKVTNDTGATLLPGRVEVFLGPDYVGRSRIGLLATGQKFDLDLGVAPDIRVKRTRLTLKRGKSGLFGSSRRISYAWRTEIISYRAKPVKIVVMERVPVSTEDKIRIRIDTTPEPTKYDKKRGMIKWIIELKPKEKQIIDFGFTVRYPKERRVRGI